MNGFESETAAISGHQFDVLEFSLPKRTQKAERGRAVGGGSSAALFCIQALKVREVIRLPALEAVPAESPSVLGVFQWRQQVVPLVSLSSILGLGPDLRTEKARVLVVEVFGGLMGLLVASVTRIRRVSSDEIVPPQVSAFSGVRGLFLDESRRFVFFLDLEKALTDISIVQTTRSSQMMSSDISNHSSFLSAEECKPVIVIVDESLRARAKTIEFLRPYPVEVIESTSGNEAFRECRRLNQQRRNFVVFSEIDLPDMDGFTFVRNLRRFDEFADVPLFLYGNFICDSEKHRALEAGADAVVGKFDKMHLQAVISAYLDVVMAREEVRQVS